MPVPKICPSCTDEFVHSMTRCPSCDVDLVLEGTELASATTAFRDDEELVPLRTEQATAWIEQLVRRLTEEGIPCRVAVPSQPVARTGRGGDGVVVLVRVDDLARAREIDAEVLRTQMPDLSSDVDTGVRESEACPACGHAIGEAATECPDCGLVFG